MVCKMQAAAALLPANLACVAAGCACSFGAVLAQQGVKQSVLTAETPLTPILAIGSNAGVQLSDAAPFNGLSKQAMACCNMLGDWWLAANM